VSKKILIIDDAPVIRELLTDVLTDLGYSVDTAVNGKIGSEMALSESYELIFCDVHMPIMSGLNAVIKIKEKKPEIPIIMTDSFPDKDAELAGQAGALCCLTKPFDLDELRRTITRLLTEKPIYRE
jgi:two-component system, response regulator, stage 0 sporulation protein F